MAIERCARDFTMPKKVLDIKKVRESREARERAAYEARTTRPISRPLRLKDKRRRKMLMIFIGTICGALLLLVLLGLGSYLDRLSIAQVDVRGAELLDAQEVGAQVEKNLSSDSFQLFSRRNVFLYPQARIERELRSVFPRIHTVTLSRDSFLSQTLAVSVVERKPYATWCTHGSYTNCYVMDVDGFVYAKKTTETPSSTYIFRGGLSEDSPVGQTFLLGRLERMTELLAYLAQNGFAAEGVEIMNDQDFEAPLLRGPVLRISFDTDPSSLVKNLSLALESDALRDKFMALEYIDLRFGNKVFFKFKGNLNEVPSEDEEA